VVFSLDVLEPGPVPRRVESIKLTESTWDGSIEISGVDLDLFFIEFGVEEVESLYVLFVEGFS
jgi:hypothetical protein